MLQHNGDIPTMGRRFDKQLDFLSSAIRPQTTNHHIIRQFTTAWFHLVQ